MPEHDPQPVGQAITPAEAPAFDKPAMMVSRTTGGGLMPRNFDELYRLARVMAASGMMPQGMQKPEQVFVAVQLGLEIGLSPMQSAQSVCVINGRPSCYGDSAKALCLASGLVARFRETWIKDARGEVIGATCYTLRKGVHPDDGVEWSFTIEDAKKAGLWGKKGTWTEIPRRMMQMRARGFALRDAYPDVLKGVYLREELEGVEMVPPTTAGAQSSIEAKLSAIKDRLAAIKAQSADEATAIEAVLVAEDIEEPPEVEAEEQDISGFEEELPDPLAEAQARIEEKRRQIAEKAPSDEPSPEEQKMLAERLAREAEEQKLKEYKAFREAPPPEPRPKPRQHPIGRGGDLELK